MKFVSAGCSFCDVDAYPENWTVQLANRLNVDHTPLGFGSASNGYISRKVIYHLSKLENVSDILVGIMWSHPDRREFYLDKPRGSADKHNSIIDNDTGTWVTMNPWRNDSFAKIYYADYYNEIGHVVETYEHILRVQWYLKNRNIKYFMLQFKNHVLGMQYHHPQLVHLWNLMDHTYINDTAHHEWAYESGLPFPVVKGAVDDHPGPEQSAKYTDEIIIPFLKDTNLI